MSYNRIAEFLQDYLNLPLSEGTIDNILKECTEKARPAYEEIRNGVQSSLVIGCDETGIKINEKRLVFYIPKSTHDASFCLNEPKLSVYFLVCLKKDFPVRFMFQIVCLRS